MVKYGRQRNIFIDDNPGSDARRAAEALFRPPPIQPVVQVVQTVQTRRVLPALPQQSPQTKAPMPEVLIGKQEQSSPGISNKQFASILGLLRHGMSVTKVAQAYDIPAKRIWKELLARKIKLGDLRAQR